MELSATLQLEQMSLGDAKQSSPRSSSPPPSDSHSPPSFNSLPPELITHIFESIPSRPYNDHVAILASLCRVNHHFLEIARPLLYHQIYLDFLDDYNQPWSVLRQTFRTLLKVQHCSVLVKAIRSSMEEISPIELTALAYLLSQLECLESVQTGLIDYREAEELMDAIGKHQPKLKHLELRGVTFGSPNQWRTLLKLEGLETLVGDQFDSIGNGNLNCKLQRFVSHSPLPRPTFERILHSSWTTLTSLAFAVNPDYADLDLRRLKNLDTLRLVLEEDTSGTMEPPEPPSDLRSRLLHLQARRTADFVEQFCTMLRSAQLLPIKTLSITVREDYIPQAMKPHFLFDILPPSIRHFGTVFEFLDPQAVNYLELVRAKRDGRLPQLEKITIFPSEGDTESYRRTPDPVEQSRCRQVEKELGITVAFHSTSPNLVTQGYLLEPYVEESDGEEEDEEGSEGYY